MKYVNMEGNKGRNDGLLMEEDDFYIKNKRINVTDLKLVTGGKDGGNGGDWLSPLPEGAVFLIKDKHNRANFMMLRLEIVHKYSKAILLYESLNDKPFGCVDPIRFCGQFDCAEIVHIPEKKEETDGEDTGADVPESTS